MTNTTTTATGPDVIEHEIGATGELVIRFPAGDLELRAVDGTTARVRDLDGRDLADRFDIERGDGRLAVVQRSRLTFDFGLPFGRRAASRLLAEVPARAQVSVETASGGLRGSGLSGEQRYRTASGGIDLARAGGRLRIDAVSGGVDIRAAGNLELTGRVVSGDARLSGGRLQAMDISTTSGDVDIDSDLPGPGPYAIQTVSGDASVAARAGLRVEAQTLTGRISTDDPQRTESSRGMHAFVLGDGRLQLAFRSISGNLRLAGSAGSQRRRVEPAPAAVAAVEPDERSAARLAILKELEDGRIDVAAATARLADLEVRDDA